MLRNFAFAVAALICISSTGSSHADDALLEQFYGNGVHAYNQRDYQGAHAALTAAIKGGTKDPRAFYFRGLTYLELGRFPEAQADFQSGAELEVADSADFFPVNRSLERIQGRSRQMLEQYRNVVHATAIQRKEAERRARYEERAAAEQDVLRRVQPTELPSVGSGPITNEAAASPAEENPFAKPAENSTAPPETKNNDKTPEKVPAAEEKNPFDSEPSKAVPMLAPAANDDPFSEPQPASTAPATKPNSGSKSAPADQGNNRPVEPAAGGVGSLFRAVQKGLEGDKSTTAAAPSSASLPDVLRGILGKNQAVPAGSPDSSPQPMEGAAQDQPPQQVGGQPPASRGRPTTYPTAPAATPPPDNPAETPKDDNPFN